MWYSEGTCFDLFLTTFVFVAVGNFKGACFDLLLLSVSVNVDSLIMPPTPPSSASSDSEGGQSPQPSAPSSPIRQLPLSRHSHSPTSKSYSQPLFTSPVSCLPLRELKRKKEHNNDKIKPWKTYLYLPKTILIVIQLLRNYSSKYVKEFLTINVQVDVFIYFFERFLYILPHCFRFLNQESLFYLRRRNGLSSQKVIPYQINSRLQSRRRKIWKRYAEKLKTRYALTIHYRENFCGKP